MTLMDWRAGNKGDRRGVSQLPGDGRAWLCRLFAGPRGAHGAHNAHGAGEQHQGLRFLQAPSAASPRKAWRVLRNEETGHRDHLGHGAQTRAAGV